MSPPQKHIINAGDVVCASRGAALQVLLGSCVSIILTTPDRRIAAVSHILLTGLDCGRGARGYSYGDRALERMYTLLAEKGVRPPELEAFAYGGGEMWKSLEGSALSVGARNAAWALAALARDGVRLLHECTGGSAYRRVTWTIGSGDPVVRLGEMA